MTATGAAQVPGLPGWRPLAWARAAEAEIVATAQRAVALASLPGREEALARFLLSEMTRLGYDEAGLDAAGNVIGRLRGAGGPSVMLHAHMDVVGPGDEALWRHPPFAAVVEGGRLWGRGASDDKGCLVAQLYAGALLRRAGVRPAGDVYVVGVVHEEDGGMGTRHLLTHLRPDLAVIGEPSACTLRRGHRGRLEWVVTLNGRSVHASVPASGLNPLYSLARFLLGLREMAMHGEPVFGGSTVAPTVCTVDQTNSNVVPAQATVHLDWRMAPGETAAATRAKLEPLVAHSCEIGVSGDLAILRQTVRAYTGLEMEIERSLQGYLLAEDDERLVAAHRALEQALLHPVATGVWQFCTDGGHLAAAGIPCVGFGPGDPAMAHVRDESLSLAELVEGVAGYVGLAARLGSPTT